MPVALGVNGGVLGSNNLPSSGSAKGIWTTNEIARAVALGFWPVNYARSITETATGADVISTVANADPYFNLTTLLLSTTATNGQQNNTFLDSSTNNFTITRNGNTTQGTFSPFSQTGWGGAFNTSTTYLTVTDTANLRFGSSNFTIEAWVYRNASGATQTIASKGASTPTGWVFQISSADKLVFTDTSTSITGTTSIAANTWTYVAVVRAGTGANQTTLYVNGTSDGTGTSATNFNQTSNMLIGADRSTTNFANGYISNLRLSNTNRTISSTPTTALTADANTIFLSLNINRFQYTDSTAVLTNITATGTPSVVPFSPFNPTSAWSASTVGGSGYFDGTGDYLSVTHNAAFNLGSNDWCIELFIYKLNNTTATLVTKRPNNGVAAYPNIFANASNQIGVELGGATFTTASSIQLNAWTHIAIVKSGSGSANVKCYINGTADANTGTLSSAITSNTNALVLAGDTNGNYMTGYMSNFRMVNGSPVYTSNFTLPTAPLTNITNTSLLLNFTNSGIYDATAKNVLETVGNAQVSTTQSKWSPTSMYFDGAGSPADSLLIPASRFFNQLYSTTQSFTLEFWIYPTAYPSSGNAATPFCAGITTGSVGWRIDIDSGGTIRWVSNGANTACTSTVSLNTWTYFAYVWNGTTIQVYKGGTAGNSATTSWTNNNDSLLIGRAGISGYDFPFTGYLQDVRLTVGKARTISLPTAAFPVQ